MPDNVSLYASWAPTLRESLGDYIARGLVVVVSFLEDVYDVVLIIVEPEGNDIVSVINVTDVELLGCPVWEVKLLAKFGESQTSGT